MKVTFIPIVIGALGTVIQTTALLRSARILRRVLETLFGLVCLLCLMALGYSMPKPFF